MARDITLNAAAGEYMDTVTVVAWHVAPGARVAAGDLLVTVETAKAASEIESPCDGVLAAISAGVGDEVAVGASLGRIAERDEAVADVGDAAAPAVEPAQPAPAPAPRPSPSRKERVVASPLARRLARMMGVDLSQVKATGAHGRIKRRDVEAAAAQVVSRPARRDADAVPIVFIHGVGADAAIWRAVAPALERRHRIVRLDLPGHGAAPALDAPGFDALVDAVATALRATGLARAHVVGHSLGGAVALALADGGSLDVRSLCLIAPAGLGPEIDGAFLSGFARATRADSLRPWLERLVAEPARLPRGFAEATLRMRGEAGVRDAQARLIDALFPDGTQGVDLTGVLARVRVPAKLIWGRSDRIIPWRHALAAPGSVALHLIGGVGHMPQIETPDLVAALIDEAVHGAP